MDEASAAAGAGPSRVAQLPTWLINRASVLGNRLLREGFAAAGLHGYKYRLLAALEEFGPASQAALGRRSMIDRSDVVAAIDDLVDRGLVKRARDPRDGRRNVITITRAGTAKLRQLDLVVTSVQDELLAPLSSADRRELVRLLSRVVEHEPRR